METLYMSLKARCDEAGTNITEVCREARIDRSVLARWKTKTPTSIATLQKFEEAIEAIRLRKQGAVKASRTEGEIE